MRKKLKKKKKEEINKKITSLRKRSNFLENSPGSLKLVTHMATWKYVKTKWVVFLDNDMILLKPIDKYLDNKTDYIFTWRQNNMHLGGYPWINAGTMICRNKKKVRSFWAKYYKKMLHNVFNKSIGDQYGFVELLPNFNASIDKGKKLLNFSKKKIFIFKEQNINFKAVNCFFLNHIYADQPINKNTCIIHLKGLLGTIITKTKKDNRYLKFYISRYFMSLFKKKIIKTKINIWKSFSSRDIAKKVIDL